MLTKGSYTRWKRHDQPIVGASKAASKAHTQRNKTAATKALKAAIKALKKQSGHRGPQSRHQGANQAISCNETSKVLP